MQEQLQQVLQYIQVYQIYPFIIRVKLDILVCCMPEKPKPALSILPKLPLDPVILFSLILAFLKF